MAPLLDCGSLDDGTRRCQGKGETDQAAKDQPVAPVTVSSSGLNANHLLIGLFIPIAI